MSSSPTTLFARLRSRARAGILIEGAAVICVVLIGFMVVSFALDRTLRLEEIYRISLLVVLALGVWYVLRRHVLRPMGFQLSDDELALAVERGGDLHQKLISAVQFERVIAGGRVLPESTELMQSVVRDVHESVPGMREGSALDTGRVRRFGAVLLGCIAVVGTWAIMDSGSLLLWAKRNLFMSSEDWPRASALAFTMDEENGVVRVAEGNDLTVEVVSTGRVVPDQVFLEYEFPDGSSGREPMALSGGADTDESKRFTWLLESVISDATLHVFGGDAKPQTIRIEMVMRPVLQDVTIKKTFPAYMKLEPELVDATVGDMRIPAGITLEIQGESTKKLENAFLTFGQGKKQLLELDQATGRFKGTFHPEKSGVLTLDVTDRDGLGANRPPKLFLRVLEDQAPLVEYRTNGIGSMILFKAIIPGSLKIRDDFGITKIASKIRISGLAEDSEKKPGVVEEAPWEEVKFEGLREPAQDENELDYSEGVVWDLLAKNKEELGPTDPKNPIRPGMMLSILFEATDNFGPGEPHVGQSEVLTLRIVEQEKLMQDLRRRQIERRRELEQILEKEKSHRDILGEILSPTSSDPRATQARRQIKAVARDQRALEKQVLGVANRFQQILDEYFNNRLLPPAQVLAQRQAIQLPLEKLGKEDFPDTAQATEAFSHNGLEDQRTVVVSGYTSIIRVLEEVISQMRKLETVAGILEDLRRIKEQQRAVEQGSKAKLNEADKDAKKIETPKKGEKADDGQPPDSRKNGKDG